MQKESEPREQQFPRKTKEDEQKSETSQERGQETVGGFEGRDYWDDDIFGFFSDQHYEKRRKLQTQIGHIREMIADLEDSNRWEEMDDDDLDDLIDDLDAALKAAHK